MTDEKTDFQVETIEEISLAPRHSFHISDIKNFTQCRTKWWFGSHMGKGKTSPTQPDAIRKGVDVHKALELWYTDKTIKIANLCDSEDTRGIMDNYMSWADQNDDFESIWHEQHFSVPFFDDHMFSGRFDLVGTRKGKIWINDWKVTGMYFDTYTDFLINQDEQMKAYSWVGHELFDDMFGGIMVTMIKSVPPPKPKILQSGKLSRDKSQKTTWNMYKEYLTLLGEDPKEYEEMRQSLEANPYVQRIQITFDKRVCERAKQRSIAIAKEMVNPNVLIYPSLSIMNCRGCWFKTPCNLLNNYSVKSAMRVLDTEYIDSEYAQDAKREGSE